MFTCGGVLIAPDVVLSAGHCGSFLGEVSRKNAFLTRCAVLVVSKRFFFTTTDHSRVCTEV